MRLVAEDGWPLEFEFFDSAWVHSECIFISCSVIYPAKPTIDWQTSYEPISLSHHPWTGMTIYIRSTGLAPETMSRRVRWTKAGPLQVVEWWSEEISGLPGGRCQLPAPENRWQTHPLREKHYVPVDGDIAGNTGFYFASMRKAAMKTLWEEVLQAVNGQWPGHPMCIWDLGKLSTWNTNLLWNNQLFGWSSWCIQVWTQGPQVQKGHRHFA